MRGGLISVWPYTWTDIWEPLATHDATPNDLFMELYPELNKALHPPVLLVVSEEERTVTNPNDVNLVKASSDPAFARHRFQSIEPADFVNERKLRHFFEEAFFIIDDFGNEEFSNLYSELLRSFLDRYNLRYTLLEPFHLCPTLPGMMAGFADQIEQESGANAHLLTLKKHLDRAVQVLSRDGKSEDVHKLIGSACNLAEGLASAVPDASTRTLGELAKELEVWPHAALKEALLKLYGFCSDYPCIRHSGNPGGQLRELTSKDGFLVSALLLAFSGYFVDLDFNEIMCVGEQYTR